MGLTLGRHLRHGDKFAKPLEDAGTATVVGGVATVVTYLATVVYLVVFIIEQRSSAYPTQTTVSLFPDRENAREGDVMKLPPTNCIAESGCWILRMNTPPGVGGIEEGGAGRQCRYYAQGEALLEDDRILWTTADAVDIFHAIWKDENFGLSCKRPSGSLHAL